MVYNFPTTHDQTECPQTELISYHELDLRIKEAYQESVLLSFYAIFCYFECTTELLRNVLFHIAVGYNLLMRAAANVCDNN